jgi:anti-sigma B factor antagonist
VSVEAWDLEARIVQQGELLIRLEEETDTQVVALYGELDLSTVEVLASTLRSVEATASEIVIDLSGLEFIDAAGLAELIGVTERARFNGDDLGFLRGRDEVHRLFVMTGMDEHLPFVD